MADPPAITFEELLRYDEEQSQRWRELLTRKPHLLKMDASPSSTIADFVFHTFTSEYRTAQRLLGEPMTPDSEFKRGSLDELWAIAEGARAKFRQYLANSPDDFTVVQVYPSHTLGEVKASPKKMLTHAVIHSIRHWAQLSRIVREHGIRIDWSADVLFSKVID